MQNIKNISISRQYFGFTEIVIIYLAAPSRVELEIPYSLNKTISNSASSAFDIFIYFNILLKVI